MNATPSLRSWVLTGRGDFEALIASFLDQRWHFDPVEASAQGVAAQDGRYGDFTEDGVRRHVAGLRALGQALEAIELPTLDDEVDRTALLNDARLQEQVWTRERPHVRNPGWWVGHLLEGLHQLLADGVRPPGTVRTALGERVRGIPALLDAAQATVADCPRPFVETATAMLGAGRPLVLAAASAGGDEVSPEARDAAFAALDRFDAFLHGDLLERAQEDFAVGLDAFNYRLAFQHALRPTAPELLRYGAGLLETVSTDLERMAHAMRPGTAWPDLLDRLRADHPVPGRLVPSYTQAMESSRAFLAERHLVTLDDTPLEVVATPSFLVPVIPFAAYQPPPLFGPPGSGRFYVTEAQDAAPLWAHCVHEVACRAVHEGWPGHHLQFARAARHERTVRRCIATPVMVEGWATYCEQMLTDAGFVASHEERFFQRVALLWRAVRVVLDIGLHTQNVTRAQAVELLVDRVHMDRGSAEAEVRRYAATPAYQLAYAVGRRELERLRDDCRIAWGDGFTLRRFHDAVLQYGGLPVSLARWGMGLDG